MGVKIRKLKPGVSREPEPRWYTPYRERVCVPHAAEIKKMYDARITLVEIGRKLGISQRAISQYVKDCGWKRKRPSRKGKRVSKLFGHHARIKTMINVMGMSHREVAKRFSVTPQAIDQIVKKYLREG